jgi:hypothetical protein
VVEDDVAKSVVVVVETLFPAAPLVDEVEGVVVEAVDPAGGGSVS